MNARFHQWFALLLLTLAITPSSQASRWWHPMGYYIAQSDLIVIADTKGRDTNYLNTIVSVREVLKGDSKFTGQNIVLKKKFIFSSQDAYVPLNSNGVAILLKPGWQGTNHWPVSEAYTKPEDVEALRVLVPICGMTNERARLLALQGTLQKQNPVYEQEMFAQLKNMQSPANYDFVTNLYPILSFSNKLELLRLVGQMGDLRGIPLLITATSSADTNLSKTALFELQYNFPGGPGVTAAFEQALKREHLAQSAASYLVERRSDQQLESIAAGKRPLWYKARRLLLDGKTNEARRVYLDILHDPQENYDMRVYAVYQNIKSATALEKDEIRQTLLPLMETLPQTNSFVFWEVVRICRELRHPDCLPFLLLNLQLNSNAFDDPLWTATMGIRELGSAACDTTAERIVQMLKAPPPKSREEPNPARYLLELLWLGTERRFIEAEAVMRPEYRPYWNDLSPLRGLSTAADEGAFLLEKLSSTNRPPGEALKWIVMTLGDLKDQRAIPALIELLPTYSTSKEAAKLALIAIGGPQLEAHLSKRLTHPDEQVRRPATEILLEISGDRSVQLCRRILTEPDFGSKMAAYQVLGDIGTTNDLPLLNQLADFWTGDRANHYWAQSALHSLQTRLKYDLSGPIQKTDPRK